MLGMSLLSFLVLTLIGAVVAVAYHNVVRYRFLEGNDALFGKLIVGWLGAWLGPPVFGHWLWKIENVYVVPAILGAAATVHLTVLPGKALTKRSFSWMMASRQDAAFWRRSQLSVSENAARVVVAVQVAPASGCSAIRMEADEVISVAEPKLFLAVSQWYQDFSQISDEDVRSLLDRSAASIPCAARVCFNECLNGEEGGLPCKGLRRSEPRALKRNETALLPKPEPSMRLA
jgi:uncharacterized membrane protein YeaQ/YmgE (transglycosylase-associated protein family)